MNYDKKIIEQSIKWKKSIYKTAKRLNISVEEYKRHLKRYRDEHRLNLMNKVDYEIDYKNNKATYSSYSSVEPKTPEEIIKLLKIDTSVWKISQIWNKEVENGWRISASVVPVKNKEEDLFKILLEKWEPKKHEIISNYKPTNLPKACAVLSIQDIHFGKEGNYTIDLDFENSVINLVTNASAVYDIENLYFVVGGDLINMDTFSGTTTSGTPVNNSMTAQEAYIQAFDAMHWAIKYMVNFCSKLTVIYMPGNHDRLSSFHLAHALSKSIDCPTIDWDIQYSERKVHVYGKNFNGFEHGDVSSKKTPLVYAMEYPEMWGETKHRTLFTGHYHQNRKVEHVTQSEDVGFVQRTLPSLSRTDYYHYHNKYVGNKRAAIIEIQCPNKGKIAEFTYTAG